jgi:hypothetical protein
MQVAALGNVTGDLDGMQVAAVVNTADAVDGQIAVVNVARRVRGVQLGVVNVASESELSIGVVNLIGNGYRTVEAWMSDTALANVGVKLGSRRAYTLFAAAATDERVSFGAGLGLHTPLGDHYVDLDLSAHRPFDHQLRETEDSMLAVVRGAIGWRLDDHVALFVGAQLTAAFAFGDKDGSEFSPLVLRPIERDDYRVRLAPGLFAGAAAF